MVVSVEDLADKCNNGIPYPSMLAKMQWYDGNACCGARLSCYTTCATHSTRAVAIWLFPRTLLFGLSSLDLSSNELQQLPATVLSSMTSLRSHLCGSMQWNVCMLGDTSTNQIQIEVHPSSNIRQHKLSRYLTVMFVTEHKLFWCTSDTLQTRVQYFLRALMIFAAFFFATAMRLLLLLVLCCHSYLHLYDYQGLACLPTSLRCYV